LDSCKRKGQTQVQLRKNAQMSLNSNFLAIKNMGFSHPLAPTFNVKSWCGVSLRIEVLHNDFFFVFGCFFIRLQEE
jgi:hypothetical protein